MSGRVLAALGLLLIAVIMLAACTGSSTLMPAATDATLATEAPTTVAAAGDVINLTLIGAGPGREADLTKKQVAVWNGANPDIQVDFVEGPASGTDRLGLYLQIFQAQSPDYDVLRVDVIWPGDLAEHLVDLNQYGGVEAVADDFEAIVSNNTVGGRLVALPWYTDGGLLFYRTDLLEKYGYTAPPETWAKLEEMAAKIQEGERAAGNQDFWGYVWQGKEYEGLTCDALEWIYSSGGGTIVSPEKVITINNAAASAALDRAYRWIGKISPPGVVSFAEEDSRAVWINGNAAFMRNWPYAYSLSNAADSQIAGKFEAGPLPGIEAGMSAATLGGWEIGVSKYSRHPEAAARFALWMASTEQQKLRAINLSMLPTKKSLYDDSDVLAAQPFIGKLAAVFLNAVARPSASTAPKYGKVSNIVFSEVSSVLTGEQTGQDAVANMELDLQALLGFEVGAPD